MISEKAHVAPGAQIGQNVTIMPFAYVESDVIIGDGCTIYPYASIMSGTRMGSNNNVHQNAVLGASPQDFGWKGGNSELIIGDGNVFRENVVVSRASTADQPTSIGHSNILMEGVHVSHNCQVGSHNILGYGVKIGCDCELGDHIIFSTGVVAKPRCRVGSYAFILSGCRFGEDVPPYITAKNNPIEYAGIHGGVLTHFGFSERTQRHLANAYRLVFNSRVSLFDAINQIEEQVPDGPEIREVVEFLRSAETLITKQVD